MRLVSARVKNYRIHRDVSVEFDRERTLIGGPNESGKSTLIEAVHRCLFLKATVSGDALKSMQSDCHAGQPEVTVTFETGSGRYEVTKRFSGQTGTCRLTQPGGGTWQGEDAQAKLAELLEVDEASGGRGILERVKQQWSHLWVWQGASGEDPTGDMAQQQSALIDQLQRVGGAVATQSPLDGLVASWFSERMAQIYTQRGPRVGSDLERAANDLEQATLAHDEAKRRVDSLARAVSEFDAATATIHRTTKELASIAGERQQVEQTLGHVQELERLEKSQADDVKTATERQTALEDTEQKIAEKRSAISELRTSLHPEEEALERLELRLSTVRAQAEEAEGGYDLAVKSTAGAQLTRDLAAAYVRLHVKTERCAELRTRLEHVEGLQTKLHQTQAELAKLASVDEERVKALRLLEKRHAEALAALDAMATEIELLGSDQPVRVGDVHLTPGDSHTVCELAALEIGESVRLRIRPGGGERLAEARDIVRTSREELRRSLDKLGLESVGQAEELANQASRLKAQLDADEAALKEWDPEGLTNDHKLAENERDAAQADLERRAILLPEAPRPGTSAEADAWLGREESSLGLVQSNEVQARAEWETLRRQVGELDEEVRRQKDSIADDKQRLIGLVAQEKLLVNNAGSDEDRDAALQAARKARSEAEARLNRTREDLAALQPDLLKADRDRLERARTAAEDSQREARVAQAVAKTTLRSDGADDPVLELHKAAARLASASEHHDTVDRKSRAIKLLDDLFQREQQAMADRFSEPLAENITAYLQCLFGSTARASVEFRDNCLKGIALCRSADGGAFHFCDLSGGTREQFAAAVRLAVAELLAAQHGNSLPLVFDDAFSFSDPDRVCQLQRMLDRGASQGLQIIVLTCNPSDYAGLGARQVTLQ